MRVLITGVTGFIGSHLAERLLAAGTAVRGVARRPAAAAWLAGQGAEIVQADLTERAGLEAAVQGCDVVLHAAAWTGGPEMDERTAWISNVDQQRGRHRLAGAGGAGGRRATLRLFQQRGRLRP